MTTAYDRVAYPTTVFAQTHPDRLAVLARLGGLDPVPPEGARVLEIGGGTCFNLISLAAIWPGCEAHGFDLSESAIARGKAIAGAAKLANVHLAVDDILEAHRRYPARSFDYVIVHGVYAWVPPHVREATMALVGHVLSERGVAFVSYNCMPGGHIRMIMREMLLDVVGGIDDPDAKIAATRGFLTDYVAARDGDDALAMTLRQHAGSMLERPDAVLFHDELGPAYHPQRLLDVVAHGAAHSLKFLTDAGRNLHLNGFASDPADSGSEADAAVALAASRNDYASLRFFRQTLFVRDSRQVDRQLDSGRIRGMYLSTQLKRQDDGSFAASGDAISIAHEGLAAAIERAAELFPQRVPVAEIADSDEHLSVIIQLFTEWYVNLHPGPAPFADRVGDDPGDRPETSPLVRGMLALGEQTVCNLDHRLLKIEQPELRALLMAADGSRTVAAIADAIEGFPAADVAPALTAAAGRALICK